MRGTRLALGFKSPWITEPYRDRYVLQRRRLLQTEKTTGNHWIPSFREAYTALFGVQEVRTLLLKNK